MILNANEVKIKGVSIFEKMLKETDELIINVRGKNKFVVLDIERYEQFREYELDLAHMKIMEDIKNNNYKIQTAQEHKKELLDEL